MKHKAKESLDFLEEECRSIKQNESKKYVNTLQDLINCQLTVDELDELLLTLGLKIHDMDYLQIRNDRLYLLNKIIEKVKKQKEMWVSDDEYMEN